MKNARRYLMLKLKSTSNKRSQRRRLNKSRRFEIFYENVPRK